MKIYNFIICMLFVLILNNAHAQKNLVQNSGFEEEDFYGWNNNGAIVTPWDFKSGKNSCAIITKDAANWVGIDQSIRIPKNAKALAFSAWLKATNVVKGKDPWNGAVFSIEFLNGDDKKIGEGINIATITGDQPWGLYKKAILIPDKAASFRILLAMGYASGQMLVDDVSASVISVDDLGK
jgi:hypothetical protein